MQAKSRISAILPALFLCACATTSEMPLAPNVVRLDTQASGLLFTSAAPAITMKKAAESTLSRGYTHFRIDQAQTAQGQRLVGVQSSGNAYGTATTYGNTTYGRVNGSSFSTPVYAPTSSVGITVVMFRADEPGAVGAWDAADVLKKQGRV